MRPQCFEQGHLHFVVELETGEKVALSSAGKDSAPWVPGENVPPLSAPRVASADINAWRSRHALRSAELFERLRTFFRTWFAVSDETVLDILALYTVLTYLYTAFDEVPYLALEGEPNSGKTQVALLMSHVAFNAVLSASVSPPAIPRIVELTNGTLILDEQNRDDGAWRDVLRSGYRKRLYLVVCGRGTHNVVARPTYGPKVMLTNEPLRDAALASRTLRVLLLTGNKAPRRYVEHDVEVVGEELRAELFLYALENVHLVRARFEHGCFPPGLCNRDLDLAAHLLTLARLVDDDNGDAAVTARLTRYLVAQTSSRRSAFRDEAARPVLARCVVATMQTDWIRADEFTAYVNNTGLLGRTLSSREVGRMLNVYGLVVDRQVRDVDQHEAPTDLFQVAPRLQKQHYRLNVELAKTWLEQITEEGTCVRA